MFFGQLLKIIFIAIIIYWMVRFVRFLIRIGLAMNSRRAEDEKQARQDIRKDGPRMRKGRNGTIELDKDQYKVE